MDYHLLNDHLYRQISGKDFQSKAEMTQKKEVASVVKEHTPFVATCKLIRAFSKPKLSYIDFVSVYIQVVVYSTDHSC